MLSSLQGFDPVKFLGVNTDTYTSEGVARLRSDLMQSMGEYVILKIASDLNEEDLNKISQEKDGAKLFAYFSQINPNLNQKIIDELENFKKDYQSQN